MDCAQLKHDIDELSMLKKQLENCLDIINDSGKIKIGDPGRFGRASETQDQILERYLDDFIEHDRDCFRWSNETALTMPISIEEIAAMPDGSVAILTDNQLCFAEKQADGSYVLNDKKKGAMKNGSLVNEIHPTPDGGFVLVGDRRVLRYEVTADGIMQKKGRIRLPVGNEINASAVLDNGDIILSAYQAGIAAISAEEASSGGGRVLPDTEDIKEFYNSEYTRVSAIPNGFAISIPSKIGFFEKQSDGGYASLAHITPPDGDSFDNQACLDNGDMFIVTRSGGVHICKKGEADAPYSTLQEVGNISAQYADGSVEYTHATLRPLQNGSMMLQAEHRVKRHDTGKIYLASRLYECKPTNDGGYQLGEPIMDYESSFFSMVAPPNGDLLAFSFLSKNLNILRPPTMDLPGLKSAIGNIAQKAPKETES